MRGFLGTAAAMVFAFALITASYSFMLVQTDLSGAAQAGPVIEMARWAVEAESYDCAMAGDPNYDGVIFSGVDGIGEDLVRVSGNISGINDYDIGFMNITLTLERDYTPRAYLYPKSSSNLYDVEWRPCDAEGAQLVYKLYNVSDGGVLCSTIVGDGNNPCPGQGDHFDLEVEGTCYLEAIDPASQSGYSKLVTVP